MVGCRLEAGTVLFLGSSSLGIAYVRYGAYPERAPFQVEVESQNRNRQQLLAMRLSV